MRAYESYRPSTGLLCPACAARHYPARRGADGPLVWCDGSPAETVDETADRLAAAARRLAQDRAEQERDRETAQVRRNARARHTRRLKNGQRAQFDAIDRGLPIPDTFPG